jgi:hypothetical protein
MSEQQADGNPSRGRVFDNGARFNEPILRQDTPRVDPCGALQFDNIETLEVAPKQWEYVHVYVYERCIKIQYLHRDGTAVGGNDSVILRPTMGQKTPKPGVTVSVFGAPDHDLKEGAGEHDGVHIAIRVRGCDNPKFFQFCNTRYTSKNPGQNEKEWPPTKTWHADPGKDIEGKFIPVGTITTGKDKDTSEFDSPGVVRAPTDSGPKVELGADANGTIYTLTHEFESFVCCGTELLGYVSWGDSMSWVVIDGKMSFMGSSLTPQTWRPANDSPRAAEVKCT